jgi:hypothetical protein
MKAIRQFVKVKNHQINITLPESFTADEVEVIILAKNENDYTISQWQIDEVRQRTIEYFKKPSIALDFEDVMKDLENDL